jgi:hypothetical protein
LTHLGLQNLEALLKKKNQTKINKQIQNLVETFIQKGAVHELEICPEEKKVILEKTSEIHKKGWTLDISATELFEPLRKAILTEYKNDSFKRFIRTPTCLELLEKYSKDRDVLLPRLAQLYNYSDEDFEATNFTENDFKFLSAFEHDNPNWELVSENKKKKLEVYSSSWNYFPNVNFLTKQSTNLKVLIALDFGFEEAVLALFRRFASTQFSEPQVLEFKFGDYCLLQLFSTIPGMSNKRIIQLMFKFFYDPEKKELTLRMKSSKIPGCSFLENQMIPLKSKDGKEKSIKATPYFIYGFIKLTRIDDKTTLLEQTTTIDVGSKSFNKSVLEKMGTVLHEQIITEHKNLGDSKKISEYKYDLIDLWEGLPKNPIGKLLWDLDIIEQDKQYSDKMEKRKKVFDISNYVIHFSSLKKKDINSAYYKFLKDEHNTDSWDFVVQYNLLKKLNEKSKFKEENAKVEEILKTFIEPKSEKDLCLGSDKILELKSKLKNRMNHYPCFKYFQKIHQDIKMEHQLDSFKRFIKTPSMIETFAKYQHDMDVMSPILGMLSTYEDEDFRTKKIRSKDLNFITSLTKNSSTWDSIYTSEMMKISISDVNWFSKVQFLKYPIYSFQFEIILPFELQQVANGYLSLNQMKKIDSNITKAKFISYETQSQEVREHAIIEMEMIWIWGVPMKKTNVCSFIYYPNELIYFSKPFETNKEWFQKDNGISEFFEYEIISLSSMKDGNTKFQHIISLCSSEKIDWKKTIIERGKSFLPTFIESIQASNPKIVDNKEKYSEMKDENEPKDALGLMLLRMDVDKKSEEVSTSLYSDDSMSETTFMDESDLMTQDHESPPDKLSSPLTKVSSIVRRRESKNSSFSVETYE